MTCWTWRTTGLAPDTTGISLMMALASLATRVCRPPEPVRAPPSVTVPGKITNKLVPRLAICSCTLFFAPSPMATMAMTAPTPMMIPNIVRKERSLFLANARSAIRNAMTNIFYVSGFLIIAFLILSGIGNDQSVTKNDLPLSIYGNVGFMGYQNDGNPFLHIEILK